MIYGVCERCSHTQELWYAPKPGQKKVYQRCFSCGYHQLFRVVRQIEQPGGSVVEVRA